MMPDGATPLSFETVANGSQHQVLDTRHWHALFVLSRHEKAISEQLTNSRIETFLPLYRARHRWGRHEARLSLPLFPNYLFVHCSARERLFVLGLAATVRIVTFQGQPATLLAEEIETLKRLTATQNPEPHPYVEIAEGKKIRVRTGPLRGLEGTIVRSKGSQRVVVSMHSITRSIVFEVPIGDL